MSVDGNFKRLEDEVTRLLEMLDDLRETNASLRSRVDALEVQNQALSQAGERLARVEEEYELAVKSREEVKTRVETILTRLQQTTG